MAQDEKSPARDDLGGKETARFVGEEYADPGLSHRKDLVAAVCIAALSVFAMVLAVRMPNPGGPFTHPGLLPFLTGLTLLAMAAALGIPAARQGGVKTLFQGGGGAAARLFGHEEGRRTILLVAIIALYVLLTDVVTFDLRYPTRLFVFRFSSFEAVSIPILAAILLNFWRAPPWRCLLVSVVFVIALAAVFRYGFHILLPGAD